MFVTFCVINGNLLARAGLRVNDQTLVEICTVVLHFGSNMSYPTGNYTGV